MRKAWAALLLAACGSGSQVIRDASEPTRPEWADKVPQSTASTLIFVGAASGASTLEEGKATATAKAFDEASRFVGVKIVAEGSYASSTEAAGDVAREQTTAVSAAQIRGALVAGTYYERMSRVTGKATLDRYDVWVLVKFPRAEVDKERARQAEEKSAKAKAALAAYTQGKSAETAGDLEGALARYREASGQLAGLDEAVDVGDPAFKSSRELEGTVKERLGATLRALRRVLMAAVGGPAGPASPVAAALTRDGYELVSPEPAVAATAQAALEQARSAGARILVALADFKISDRGQVLGQSAAGCSLVLRAIEVQNGKVVAEIAHEAKGFGPNAGAAAQDAGKNAGQEAAKKLLAALSARWGLNEKATAVR